MYSLVQYRLKTRNTTDVINYVIMLALSSSVSPCHNPAPNVLTTCYIFRQTVSNTVCVLVLL